MTGADDAIARYGRALLDAGLGRYAEKLLNAVRPSIRLDPAVVSDDELRVGASKLGGRPDLPLGCAWPAAHGIPLAFVAQLELSELGDLDVERVLPEAGLLSFFFEATWALAGNSPTWNWMFCSRGRQLPSSASTSQRSSTRMPAIAPRP